MNIKKRSWRVFRQIFAEIKGAYEKIRFTSELPESAWVYGKTAPEPLLVKENGVTYATYLNEGLMTGIFFDQKEVRGQLVDGLAAGKTVLNMFSYTGAFSVAAAVGGAAQTTSVDLAKRSIEKRPANNLQSTALIQIPSVSMSWMFSITSIMPAKKTCALM